MLDTIAMSHLRMMKPLLMAFDFDHTVVDEDTDFVLRHLVKDEKVLGKIEEMYETECCPVYMRMLFEHLHEIGVTSTDIERVISSVPPVNGIPSLMEKLHSRGIEIIVISDSNTYFINHWITQRQLDHTIKEVFSNPAHFDETGLLKIGNYHAQDWCQLSAPNMCKGHVLDSYVKKRSDEGVHFRRVAYVGDGKNDYCPVLRLSVGDFAFPRLHYTLSKILSDENNEGGTGGRPTAEIVPWTNGTEIWRGLVNRIPELGIPAEDSKV